MNKMIKKFRHKPCEKVAIQYDGANDAKIHKFCGGNIYDSSDGILIEIPHQGSGQIRPTDWVVFDRETNLYAIISNYRLHRKYDEVTE
jgi:hypothetical protein